MQIYTYINQKYLHGGGSGSGSVMCSACRLGGLCRALSLSLSLSQHI